MTLKVRPQWDSIDARVRSGRNISEFSLSILAQRKGHPKMRKAIIYKAVNEALSETNQRLYPELLTSRTMRKSFSAVCAISYDSHSRPHTSLSLRSFICKMGTLTLLLPWGD
jgi:hypothetical protein